MSLPSFLTVHVLGYGGAALLLTGTGALLLHEHDNKVKAEMHAQDLAAAHIHEDSIISSQAIAAVNAGAARVETVTVALRNVIQPTKVLVDSARKFIHDTVLVAKALDSEKATTTACELVASACDQFKKMATDSIKSLATRLQARDKEFLIAVTPPQPRFSHGLQVGVGGCVTARKIGGKESVFGAPCANLTYGIQMRIP